MYIVTNNIYIPVLLRISETQISNIFATHQLWSYKISDTFSNWADFWVSTRHKLKLAKFNFRLIYLRQWKRILIALGSLKVLSVLNWNVKRKLSVFLTFGKLMTGFKIKFKITDFTYFNHSCDKKLNQMTSWSRFWTNTPT